MRGAAGGPGSAFVGRPVPGRWAGRAPPRPRCVMRLDLSSTAYVHRSHPLESELPRQRLDAAGRNGPAAAAERNPSIAAPVHRRTDSPPSAGPRPSRTMVLTGLVRRSETGHSRRQVLGVTATGVAV